MRSESNSYWFDKVMGDEIMKIKNNTIDKELRITGSLMRIVNGIFTENGFKLLGKFKVKMKVKDNTIQFIEEWISREDGSKMRICIFKPLEPKENVPGILWLHGGGYVLGAPEQALGMAKRFIEVSNCIVIAPDYRLSVVAPYPAALEDCYEALLWMKSHAKELGIRENQLMVGGDSAGGGLTAALTLYARDKGEVAIAFQMPLYPMLDDRMVSESSRDNDAPVWNSKSNFNAWRLYLGELFNGSNVSCYAAPARAEDYTSLPPTVTFVGDLEPFRDETIQYVENLRKAGVPVDFVIYKGCYHAFEQMCPKAEVSKRAISFLIYSFKYAVNHYFAEQK
jgi:acetyl esterase/lipase